MSQQNDIPPWEDFGCDNCVGGVAYTKFGIPYLHECVERRHRERCERERRAVELLRDCLRCMRHNCCDTGIYSDASEFLDEDQT